MQSFPPNAGASNANANTLTSWLENSTAPSLVQSTVAPSSLHIPPNQVTIMKHPRTPLDALGIDDYQGVDHEQLMKRLRSSGHPVDEITYSAPLAQSSWLQMIAQERWPITFIKDRMLHHGFPSFSPNIATCWFC